MTAFALVLITDSPRTMMLGTLVARVKWPIRGVTDYLTVPTPGRVSATGPAAVWPAVRHAPGLRRSRFRVQTATRARPRRYGSHPAPLTRTAQRLPTHHGLISDAPPGPRSRALSLIHI